MVETQLSLSKYRQTKTKAGAILAGGLLALGMVAMNQLSAKAATLGDTQVNGTLSATVVSAQALQGGSLWVGGNIGTNGTFNSSGTINGKNLQTAGLWAGTGVSTGGYVKAAGAVTAGGGFASDMTRATTATHSFQVVAADLTYQGAAGGTGAFHAGVMGHFHGDTLTNSTAGTYHAGVIGAYSVTTSDAVTGPKAGVVGSVGVDAATSVPDAAVMAILDGGDPGTLVTANAAYGVQYLNGNNSSQFSYGLNLGHAAVGALDAVHYGTADIRLANGVTMLSGTGVPASSGAAAGNCNLGAGLPALPIGSLYLNASGGTSTTLYLCTAANTWTAK